MEKILDLIRNNLTGDYESDVNFLQSLLDEENKIIQNANTTIEAINIIANELEDERVEEEPEEENELEQTEEESVEQEQKEVSPEEKEIDDLIDVLFSKIDEEDVDSLLYRIENIINKIEGLTDTSDESQIHCTFSNEIERRIFEKILAGDKQIVITPYKNDELYILYADILLQKKRKSAALDALNRAIYWNFLNKDAREKKLEILHSKNQIVKYLDNLKVLQQIAYTAIDLAHVYDLYGQIFTELKDKKAAYGAYKLSSYYYPNDEVQELVESFEASNPEFKELSDDEIYEHLKSNEMQIGPNPKIIKAHRDITTEFLNEGRLDDAQILLQNDYNLTRDNQIALLYNQLLDVKEKREQMKQQIIEEEKAKATKKTTKKTTTKKKEETKGTAKKTTTKKATATTKKTTAKKTTAKKTTVKAK